eukprot:CAMPEP_0181233370 /NCGR_PEP_ID=MMETSP1096-20121128/36295_1 /TAXON_ID=156174 ORGANISM="Chrysochromulina ericina, Strain CCMP281" /NCGR_SAMPLE_ID=MMETSP1096 /ASSEMBLY_ACC=CAM_ASM_000453 /LENGTH=162 /DNA_ID=CAMNT_0023327857 /DNA_START=65 /DNA_END=553 /DNA_ORIENTATION=-
MIRTLLNWVQYPTVCVTSPATQIPITPHPASGVGGARQNIGMHQHAQEGPQPHPQPLLQPIPQRADARAPLRRETSYRRMQARICEDTKPEVFESRQARRRLELDHKESLRGIWRVHIPQLEGDCDQRAHRQRGAIRPKRLSWGHAPSALQEAQRRTSVHAI